MKGTLNYGIFYIREEGSIELYVYDDASWADDLETRKSQTGLLNYVGRYFVDWNFKRQSIISHNKAESEYVFADSATHIIVWFCVLLEGLDEKQLKLL